MQLLSTEAEGVNEAIPEEARRALVNRAGRVGALLGITDTRLGAADCEWWGLSGEERRLHSSQLEPSCTAFPSALRPISTRPSPLSPPSQQTCRRG